MQARLEKLYRNTIVPRLSKTLGCRSVMEVPHLSKIVISIGLGEGVDNKKVFEFAERDLSAISGQKPMLTRARKSISGFKIRAGWPIGYKVTLRRQRMYEFLDRLVHITIPLIRDFRGLSPKGFDQGFNYSMGIAEQIVFREIEYDRIDKLRGLNITFVTTCKDIQSGYVLLKSLGLPLVAPNGVEVVEACVGDTIPATGFSERDSTAAAKKSLSRSKTKKPAAGKKAGAAKASAAKAAAAKAAAAKGAKDESAKTDTADATVSADTAKVDGKNTSADAPATDSSSPDANATKSTDASPATATKSTDASTASTASTDATATATKSTDASPASPATAASTASTASPDAAAGTATATGTASTDAGTASVDATTSTTATAAATQAEAPSASDADASKLADAPEPSST